MPEPPRFAPSGGRTVGAFRSGGSMLRPLVAPNRPRNCPSRQSLGREG
ncbi:hypothetical protein [Azospirillum palustre]